MSFFVSEGRADHRPVRDADGFGQPVAALLSMVAMFELGRHWGRRDGVRATLGGQGVPLGSALPLHPAFLVAFGIQLEAIRLPSALLLSPIQTGGLLT